MTSLKRLNYEEKKRKVKEDKKKLQEERKRIREEKKGTSNKLKKPTSGEIKDVEEDWVCKVCSLRYSAELIFKKSKKWVECDSCLGQYHYKCIPKKHLNKYGLDDSEDDELTFICHNCTENSDEDNDFDFLTSEED